MAIPLNEKPYYDVLKVREGASWEDIKKAYRKEMVQSHPDKFPQDSKEAKDAAERTKKINEAYTYFSAKEKAANAPPRMSDEDERIEEEAKKEKARKEFEEKEANYQAELDAKANADAPKAGAPKADAPKADAPKADAPKAQTSFDGLHRQSQADFKANSNPPQRKSSTPTNESQTMHNHANETQDRRVSAQQTVAFLVGLSIVLSLSRDQYYGNSSDMLTVAAAFAMIMLLASAQEKLVQKDPLDNIKERLNKLPNALSEGAITAEEYKTQLNAVREQLKDLKENSSDKDKEEIRKLEAKIERMGTFCDAKVQSKEKQENAKNVQQDQTAVTTVSLRPRL